MKDLRFYTVIIIVMIYSLVSISALSQEKDHNDLTLTANHEVLPGVFLLGTHLCRYPQPDRQELFKDMDNLKKHGFNLIKIQTHWAIDEKVEGHYDFSNYEPLIEYAEKLGMGVYLGLTCEQAPAWLYQKYPDCRMIGRNGVPVMYEGAYTMPSDGKPGPSFYHPQALQKELLYIDALVNALSKYKNIVAWNTWQETPNYSNWKINGQSIDYNPYTLKAFTEWLRNKYKSLEALNKAWLTNFGDWELVGPNRDVDLGLPQDIDWKYFMEDVYVSNTLSIRYKEIKRIDPLKRPVFAHVSYPVIGSSQNWNQAKSQDFVGISCYPAWGSHHAWDDNASVLKKEPYESLLYEQLGGIMINTDYLRSVSLTDAPFWAAEMQGGPVATDFHKGRVPSPDDIRRWMLGSISAGCTGITFWVTRAEIMASENNGFSLLDSHGDTTPRFEEASRIGKVLMKYPELFAQPTNEKASIGIVVDETNYQFCNSLSNLKSNLVFDIRGWYKFLWQLGYPVDFVNSDSLNSQSVKRYKLLICPFSIALSDNTIDRLVNYVSNGGNLVCEAAMGRINERGLSVRGEMPEKLMKLFGVRQKSFQMVYEPDNQFRWTPHPRTWGEYREVTSISSVGFSKKYDLLSNYYLQTFELAGSTPIFKIGDEIAGTVMKSGLGKSWLIGTYLGYGATAYQNKRNSEFIDELLQINGVKPNRFGELVVRKRLTKNREAWFISNLTNHEITQIIPLGNYKHAIDLLDYKIINKGTEFEITVPSMDIRVILIE